MISSWQRTKIVCTLGPSTDHPDVLEQMIRAGMDVARINTAHGSRESHAKQIRLVREVAKKCGEPVAVLVDLPGPKFRVGELKERFAELRSGTRVVLGASSSGEETIPLSHPELIRELKKGEAVYLADGSIHLQVVETSADSAVCRVEIGGMIRSGAGINLPQSHLSTEIPTEEDIGQIAFALEQKAEWLGVSFVRTPEDIRRLRSHLPSENPPKVMAKIEKRQAVAELEEIAYAADGVMVARGDLGVETDLAEVPILQKRIVKVANELGRPVVVATQMLESMINHGQPTRAEVTDVANAVLDGADAVMLSGETAVGHFPVEAVQMLGKVVKATEGSYPYGSFLPAPGQKASSSSEEAMSLVACRLSIELNARAIIVPVSRMQTALRLIRFRPKAPVITISTSETLCRQLAVVWGIVPLLIPSSGKTDSGIASARAWLLDRKLAGAGDPVVVLSASDPLGGTLSDTVEIVRL